MVQCRGRGKRPAVATMSEQQAKRNRASKAVVQYHGDEEVAEFPSVALAADHTGISTSSISACARGRNNTAGGYKWAFALEQRATQQSEQESEQGPDVDDQIHDGPLRQQSAQNPNDDDGIRTYQWPEKS